MPIRKWKDPDEAWTEVSKAIRRISDGLQQAAADRAPAGPLAGPEQPGPARIRTNEERFLQACSAEAVPFFQEMFTEAARRDHIVQFGFKGFSQRARGVEGLISFCYGFPPNTVELYFPILPIDPEQQDRLREELAKMGAFRKAGQKTLRASINAQNHPEARKVYDAMLEQVEKIVKQGGEA